MTDTNRDHGQDRADAAERHQFARRIPVSGGALRGLSDAVAGGTENRSRWLKLVTVRRREIEVRKQPEKPMKSSDSLVTLTPVLESKPGLSTRKTNRPRHQRPRLVCSEPVLLTGILIGVYLAVLLGLMALLRHNQLSLSLAASVAAAGSARVR